MIKNTANTKDFTKLFDPIYLEELNEEKLMRRCERKFVFHKKQLSYILSKLSDTYRILEINGERVLPYQTTYFDTPDFCMYLMHHNGIKNRYKIRLRKYMVTNQHFLEIKHKSNKGFTSKERISQPDIKNMLTFEHTNFIETKTPYKQRDLKPKLQTDFLRLTLVHKFIQERVTIDCFLSFRSLDTNKKMTFDNLCIAEVKQKNGNRNTEFMKVLKEHSIYPVNFSKYCVGMSLVNPYIKKNRFKLIIERVKQLEDTI